jgi:uncharacterized protein YjdB
MEKFKKIKMASLLLVAVLAATGTLFTACEEEGVVYVAVENIIISPGALSLPAGSSKTLTATVFPVDATNQLVIWESTNTNVVTVVTGIEEFTAEVTAIAPGTATIYANGGDSKRGICLVTVTPAVLIEGLNVTNSTINLHAIGETATILLNIMPENATNKTVIYATETPGVASIDANGVVTAIGAGNTKFTVTTTDGSTNDDGSPKSDFGYIYVTL